MFLMQEGPLSLSAGHAPLTVQSFENALLRWSPRAFAVVAPSLYSLVLAQCHRIRQASSDDLLPRHLVLFSEHLSLSDMTLIGQLYFFVVGLSS